MSKQKTSAADGTPPAGTPEASCAAEPASNITSISAARGKAATKAAARESAGAADKPAFVPAVVVFGLDEQKKPHASWFAEADAELAVKAAGLMGYVVLFFTN